MSEEKKAALMAALIDFETCRIEAVGDKFRFHLKSGPVDLDRRTAERVCFKGPSI